MWELSNGAFYMAPGDKTETYPMSCAGNWYEGTMSADAAGIVACLVAFNRMAWHTREDRFTNLFYGLREWALEHPEAKEIFAYLYSEAFERTITHISIGRVQREVKSIKNIAFKKNLQILEKYNYIKFREYDTGLYEYTIC